MSTAGVILCFLLAVVSFAAMLKYERPSDLGRPGKIVWGGITVLAVGWLLVALVMEVNGYYIFRPLFLPVELQHHGP